jgi:sirohydrochlorin cobaltochelatase
MSINKKIWTMVFLGVLLLTVVTVVVGAKDACINAQKGKDCIILVGHGIPANDFPKDRLARFFELSMVAHSHMGGGHEEEGHGHGDNDHGHSDAMEEYEQLEHEVRNWPRTPENDPYKIGVENLAGQLSKKTGKPVLIAFNEFCAPTVAEAVNEAIANGATNIKVLSTMLIPGGGHSESDIPKSIAKAIKQHSGIKIAYVWPYDLERIADLMSDEINRFEAK